MDFSVIRKHLAGLPGPDAAAAASAAAREALLTKPAGSLGRLEAIAAWAATWQGRHPARAEQIQVLVFAGNHGVAARGVSAYPAEVTAQMVANFEAGGAAINQLCGVANASLTVGALALETPTIDFTVGAAMTEADCAAAMMTGFDHVAADSDLLCLGEMGIANTTAAAALAAGLFGGGASDWVGRGTGVDDSALARKCATVDSAIALHSASLDDPLAVLRCLGGREIAAVAGAILGARHKRVPVIVDGFVVCAGAAVVQCAAVNGLDHCLAGHRSAEASHGRLLDRLRLEPLLDLELRLGEGSGAALAALIVKAALATHAGMASFAEASVSEKD